MDYLIEQQILEAIENARKETEWKIKNESVYSLNDILAKSINNNLDKINFSYQDRKEDSAYVYIDNIEIEHVISTVQEHDYTKSAIGTSFVIAGQPLLKKRFVMQGSAKGTSIASKYLSKALPQKMPTRILGTRVLGRALGRAIPYVGWALLAIDVIELVIEYNTEEKEKSFFGGGGSFGGGGAGGSW